MASVWPLTCACTLSPHDGCTNVRTRPWSGGALGLLGVLDEQHVSPVRHIGADIERAQVGVFRVGGAAVPPRQPSLASPNSPPVYFTATVASASDSRVSKRPSRSASFTGVSKDNRPPATLRREIALFSIHVRWSGCQTIAAGPVADCHGVVALRMGRRNTVSYCFSSRRDRPGSARRFDRVGFAR